MIQEKEVFKDILEKSFFLEWNRWKKTFQESTLTSIYLGGGTPTLLWPKRLESLLNHIAKDFSFSSSLEITIEANPENISSSLLLDLRSIGINRLSIGLQSLNQEELFLLDRRHSKEKALWAVYTAKEAGFDNISCDLMYDTPKQTLDSWHTTLATVAKLPITHLSLYNLTIEPHTPFEKKKKILQPMLPDEETSLTMYVDAQKILQSHGFEQYEISAFAKDKKISQHNTGYWTGRPFLGFGPSAFSYFANKRFRNIPNLSRYAKLLEEGASTIDYEEEVSGEKRIKELLTLHLRLVNGIDIKEFEKKYGPLPLETKESIHALQEKGLLIQQNLRLNLSQKGILFYDTIASELI